MLGFIPSGCHAEAGPARAPLALAALAIALGPVAGAAQTVAGQVVDAEYGQAIPEAHVLLLGADGAALDSTTTDPDGRFRLAAPGPGRYLVHVRVDGYLSYSDAVRAGAGEAVQHTVEMPVVSVAAARVMQTVIDREAAFQLPIDELCAEPLRPWEAGVLVGVARDRETLQAIPRAVARLEPLSGDGGAGAAPPRDRVATATGAYWFCNVPAGRARVVVRAEGFAADTSYPAIHAGTVSWYDALLPPIGQRPR